MHPPAAAGSAPGFAASGAGGVEIAARFGKAGGTGAARAGNRATGMASRGRCAVVLDSTVLFQLLARRFSCAAGGGGAAQRHGSARAGGAVCETEFAAPLQTARGDRSSGLVWVVTLFAAARRIEQGRIGMPCRARTWTATPI